MAVSGKLAQDADASTDMMPFYPHCAHHHSAPYRLSDPVPHIPFVVPRTPPSVHILLGAVYHPTPAQACTGPPRRASWNTCPHACRHPLKANGSAGSQHRRPE